MFSRPFIESEGWFMEKVRVLLVTGTLEMDMNLKGILTQDARIEIVAEANNAYTARDKIIECNPDVMLLCHNLPRMTGIEFLRKLTPQKPVNTIVIAPLAMEIEAYNAGAKDFIPCEDGVNDIDNKNICSRLIKAASKLSVSVPAKTISHVPSKVADNTDMIIAMGASTGGTEAIATVIRGLRADVPGIVMVQHMPEGFTKMYADRLDGEGAVSVSEAKTGDVVRSGHVLLAPGDKQMRIVKVNGRYQVECRPEPRVSGHCPSVDVLFESVAKVAGKNAIGVLMTGMGRDGAAGLLAMRKAGAQTIGQDEKTCIVYGMPRVAYEMGAVAFQVPLGNISQKIHYLLGKN
jgi:two-component system chemotaxis response regulator CheB